MVFNRWRQCALPPNTCLLGPTRVPIPNDMSIGSAMFAQLMAEHPYTLQWTANSLLKIANSHGGIRTTNLTNDSLGPLEPKTQTKSQLLQPFLHSSLQSVPILRHGPPLPPQNCPFLWEGAICGPYLIHGSFGPPSPQPKRHLDQFSHFCRAHYCDRHTD